MIAYWVTSVLERAARPMTDWFDGGPVYGGTFPALILHPSMAAALADRPGGSPT